jgi:hypothetical protein
VLTVSTLGAVRFGSQLQGAYAVATSSAKLTVLYLTLYTRLHIRLPILQDVEKIVLTRILAYWYKALAEKGN